MDHRTIQRVSDVSIAEEPNEAGGITLRIQDKPQGYQRAYDAHALSCADGFYDLISANCDFESFVPLHGRRETIISLAGLVCELYFKSILLHDLDRTPKDLRKHSLVCLYENLPPNRKTILKEKMNDDSERAELELMLNEIDDVFQRYRYDYELQDGCTLYYGTLFELVRCLHQMAHEIISEPAGSIYLYGE